MNDEYDDTEFQLFYFELTSILKCLCVNVSKFLFHAKNFGQLWIVFIKVIDKIKTLMDKSGDIIFVSIKKTISN